MKHGEKNGKEQNKRKNEKKKTEALETLMNDWCNAHKLQAAEVMFSQVDAQGTKELQPKQTPAGCGWLSAAFSCLLV